MVFLRTTAGTIRRLKTAPPAEKVGRHAGVQGRFTAWAAVWSPTTDAQMHHIALFVILFVMNFSNCTAIIEKKTRFRIDLNQRKSHGAGTVES